MRLFKCFACAASLLAFSVPVKAQLPVGSIDGISKDPSSRMVQGATDGALGRANKEMLATFVFSRNSCEYCADSHGHSLRMNGGSTAMLAAAMTCSVHSESIDSAQNALLVFVQKITDHSRSITPIDIEALRTAGWSDLQIAEAIHPAALFACFNRVVNAFGLPSQGMRATIGETL